MPDPSYAPRVEQRSSLSDVDNRIFVATCYDATSEVGAIAAEHGTDSHAAALITLVFTKTP